MKTLLVATPGSHRTIHSLLLSKPEGDILAPNKGTGHVRLSPTQLVPPHMN